MCILTNLFKFSVPVDELINIYILYIRSVAEQLCTVWYSYRTKGEKNDIERIQKTALKVILRDDYISYEVALKTCGLKTLSERRADLCLSFANKCIRNEKTKDIFPLNDEVRQTRVSEKFKVTKANTDRLAKSAIPFMQRLLNSAK